MSLPPRSKADPQQGPGSGPRAARPRPLQARRTGMRLRRAGAQSWLQRGSDTRTLRLWLIPVTFHSQPVMLGLLQRTNVTAVKRGASCLSHVCCMGTVLRAGQTQGVALPEAVQLVKARRRFRGMRAEERMYPVGMRGSGCVLHIALEIRCSPAHPAAVAYTAASDW